MKVGDLVRCVYTNFLGVILTNCTSNLIVYIYWFDGAVSPTSNPHEQLELVSEDR